MVALWVEQFTEVALVSRWVFDGEETVVLAYFCLYAVVSRYPVKSTFYLAVGTFHSALADRIVFSLNLCDDTVLVLGTACTLHDIGILQANFLSRSHTEELLWSILHKVGTLNPEVL